MERIKKKKKIVDHVRGDQEKVKRRRGFVNGEKKGIIKYGENKKENYGKREKRKMEKIL
jgi:hypothetical protein